MLRIANVSVEETMKLFNGTGVTCGLLVPTETGCKKSIMDATLSFRYFLHETRVHEYSTQKQGPEHKVVVPANFVYADRCIKTSASLYRPNTKKGDPRIWFHKLTRYCKPTDLLAIISYVDELYVFNMSNHSVVSAFGIPGSYPHEILGKSSNVISSEARELLLMLKNIHRQGFVKGVSQGDTNIGMTLEHLLGIAPNASKLPDYKGIEIKASRIKKKGVVRSGANKKITLFTNVPDWSRSHFSASQILKTFGYEGERGRRQLYCTVSNRINPQGLYLDASDEIDLVNRARTEQYTGDVAVWALDTLKQRLAEKHKETFWVEASVNVESGVECFRYDIVRHTRKPNVTNIGCLFDTGIITLDYAMHEKPSGGVRDHGYLFRTTLDKFSQIFPIEKEYVL